MPSRFGGSENVVKYLLTNYSQLWYLLFRKSDMCAEILLRRTVYLNAILAMLPLAINILHFRAVWQIAFDPALFNCRGVEGSPYIPGTELRARLRCYCNKYLCITAR